MSHSHPLFHPHKMGAQVFWMFICFVAAVYLNFSVEKFVPIIFLAQIFLAAEALTELGLLLDFDVLKFKAEMIKFFFAFKAHFATLRWLK